MRSCSGTSFVAAEAFAAARGAGFAPFDAPFFDAGLDFVGAFATFYLL
jgi:hypothetical protein